MVSYCANPHCHKPLHYLREGRIFVFEVPDSPSSKRPHRLEHYWLCGECSQIFTLRQQETQIRLLPRRKSPAAESAGPFDSALAS